MNFQETRRRGVTRRAATLVLSFSRRFSRRHLLRGRFCSFNGFYVLASENFVRTLASFPRVRVIDEIMRDLPSVIAVGRDDVRRGRLFRIV